MFKRIAGCGAVILGLLGACGGGGSTAEPAAPAPALPAGWTRLADLPSGVAKFGVAALGGKLYVVGGYDTRHTVMVYDIASNSWSSGPPLPRGTDNVAALATDTPSARLYALGGEAGTAVQVFDPATQAWNAGPALGGVRFASAAAVLGQRLHLVGGWNANNSASASLATQTVFDIATQAWAAAAPLATARNAAAAAVIDDRLYVVGGRAPGIRASDQSSLGSMEIYNPGTDQWSAGAALPTARGSLAVVALGGRLYALGGESAPGTVSNAVERYDPASGAWSALAAMPYRSHGLGAVVVGGAIYVMGGFTGASDAVGTESVALYRYQPAN
jgi:N-acetylneuraminic acid mutarotase